MSKDFLTSVTERRSYYGISKESAVPDSRIKELITLAVKYTPSAFNSQTTRVVLLLKGQHDRLWEITKEALRKIVPADQFGTTEERINAFESGYGTVLYFEDQEIVESLQQNFELYKDNFPIWSQQSNGMSQFIIWNALENEGLGASLQHYNELIEDDIKKEWEISLKWKLIAQMPFGKPTAEPGEKEFKPLDERIKFFE